LAARAALDQDMPNRAVHTTYSTQDAVGALRGLNLGENDIVLVKGGTAARMELVVQELLANEEDLSFLVRQDDDYEASLFTQPVRPTWVEIDTDALANNVQRVKAFVGEDVALMAVVKSNAYGHGAITCARTALLNGASYLSVASLAEALELRDAGIEAPILILSYMPISGVRQAMQQDITVGIYDLDLARSYNRAAAGVGGKLRVHFKVDTGMGRLGVFADEAIAVFRQLGNLTHLDVEGIYTHYATADEDDEYAVEQLEIFKEVLRPLRASGYQFQHIHAANSAALLTDSDYHFNMIRPGITLYGLYPGDKGGIPDGLQPVMAWKTVVAQVRKFPPGYPIGYGNTYRTRSEETIAILPVGYADGLRRSPRTWHHVLIQGQRAPLVGRVSMEKCAVNVSHIPGVSIGDEVILMGKQGDDAITAEEIAEWLGTINYEVITTILPRIPRQ
jgi:alanine racemase